MNSKLRARTNLLSVVFFSVAAVAVFAHPPKTPTLELNPTNTRLTIRIDHAVRGDGNTHFIDRIVVSVNGKAVTSLRFRSQPELSGLTKQVRLSNIAPGDKITVKASCNVFGWRTAKIVAPTPKKIAAKEPELKKSADLLKIGSEAPVFKLKNQSGKEVNLKAFRGKRNVVLVFYPNDNTPVCTRQLCAIRDDFVLFSDAETVVFGINSRDAESHAKFIKNFNFPFALLVDVKKKVIGAYGCDGQRMVRRTVYTIDKKGAVVFAKRGLPTNKEILAPLK